MIEETTHQSWLSRLGESVKGLVAGGILFVAAFPMLFLNEGRAVRTAKGLSEGAAAVVRAEASVANPEHDGRFVHISGKATTSDVMQDQDFGVSVPGIRLKRHVEMYQWKETKEEKKEKKLGGGTKTVTRYDYQKVWAPKLIDSGDFKQIKGHRNPSVMPFEQFSTEASDVQVGAFRLPQSLIAQIDSSEPVELDASQLPADLADRGHVVGDGPNGGDRLYLSHEQGTSTVGDVRVWFTATPSTDVSVMAKQTGDSFEPFHTSAGTELNMLSVGVVSPESMISAAESANVALTWLLRGIGLAMMCGGIALFLRPLSVVGDVVPLVGSIIEVGTTGVAMLVGGGFSLCTISVAWLFYRPLIGLPLLAVGIGLLVQLVRRARRNTTTRIDQPQPIEPSVVEQPVAV